MAALSAPFIDHLRAETWMLSRDAHERSWSKPGRPDRRRVLEDHGYCCHFCGLVSHQGMDIHHKNGNHSDFDRANLCPICPLCHQSFHPGFTGRAREASLVIAPDIDQWTLNRLALALYHAEDEGAELARPAYDLLSTIRARGQQVIQRLGSDNPHELCAALLGLKSKERDAAIAPLSSLRLFPLPRIHTRGRNQFQGVLRAFKGDAPSAPRERDYVA